MPWYDYELVDEPGSGPNEIGVRHKKTGELFTPTMMMALKNPMIMGPGVSGSQGAMILQKDGTYIPNTNIEVDDATAMLNRDVDLSSQAVEEYTEDGASISDYVESEGAQVASKYEEEK